MSFANLKSQSKSSVDALKAQLQAQGGTKSYGKENFWTPTLDKAGNGGAIIRFLPAKDGEQYSFVKRYSHGFKVGGKWFIEECPTTVGGKCPICESNSVLWNADVASGGEDFARAQNQKRGRKRQLSYYANVLVISDKANPDNEGQVKLYRYGAKIHDKIMAKLAPPEAFGEQPVNIFDPWTGADFRLKIKKVAGFPNYDESAFADATALEKGDDKKIEAIWKRQHSLDALVAPTVFKSYEALQSKFNDVVGLAGFDVNAAQAATAATTTLPARSATKIAPPAASKPVVEEAPFAATNSGDEELEYLRKLAEEND